MGTRWGEKEDRRDNIVRYAHMIYSFWTNDQQSSVYAASYSVECSRDDDSTTAGAAAEGEGGGGYDDDDESEEKYRVVGTANRRDCDSNDIG